MRTATLRRCLLGVLWLLPLAAQASSTLRCGSDLLSVEDSMDEVRQKCGRPASRTTPGYVERTDDYGFRHGMRVEEWMYGPRNGMYQYLRFEGGRLVGIDSRRGQ
jgi:hypothetical protein